LKRFSYQANIAVCRSYLSAATKIDERTGAVSMVSLAQVLGFVVGPALQVAVSPLGNDGVPFFYGWLHFDMYTATGWLNVILGVINCLMFLPVIFKVTIGRNFPYSTQHNAFCQLFQERKIAAKEVMVMQGMVSEKETWKAIKPDYFSAWLLITAFFVLVFNFVLLET
jgi:MFS transporter, ceroid-lipofuscinosis neuronal protein 7